MTDSDMFVWNKIAVTQPCFFDDAIPEKALRLLPDVPEITEKQKKSLNFIDCLRGKMFLGSFQLGLEKAWFTNIFLKLAVVVG